MYPRVIVAESVITSLIEVNMDDYEREGEMHCIFNCVTKDSVDEFYYVDYITKAQSELDYPDTDYHFYIAGLKQVADVGVANESEYIRDKLQSHIDEIEARFQNVSPGLCQDTVSAYEALFRIGCEQE